jgi:hypothetical protein
VDSPERTVICFQVGSGTRVLCTEIAEVHFLEVPLEVREKMLRNPEVSRVSTHLWYLE